MLSLFLELRARLPNVIIGAITRESMRRALATGIRGRQVLDFLKWHAHPVVRRRTPVVPENIADQVCEGMCFFFEGWGGKKAFVQLTC